MELEIDLSKTKEYAQAIDLVLRARMFMSSAQLVDLAERAGLGEDLRKWFGQADELVGILPMKKNDAARVEVAQ